MRVVQPRGTKGSQKWIQQAVNQHSEYLNRVVRDTCRLPSNEAIEWVSPLEDDEWAEYRDAEFLELLGVQLSNGPLSTFWPQSGPQWDALGRTDSGDILLVEAKAHVSEVVSRPCGATSPRSLARIKSSLAEVQCFLNVDNPRTDWMVTLYQYANRLAHLYLLRELNNVQAHLLFVHFVGDDEVDGPRTIQEWQTALLLAKRVLGLPSRHRLSDYVSDIFIEVRDMV